MFTLFLYAMAFLSLFGKPFFPEISGGAMAYFQENGVEAADRAETAIVGDIGDTHVGCQ